MLPAHLCFQKQVCNDIGRRLTVLEDAWAQGKLSAPVRKRMSLLVQGMGWRGLYPCQQQALGQRHPRDSGSCAPDGILCPGRASAAALGRS